MKRLIPFFCAVMSIFFIVTTVRALSFTDSVKESRRISGYGEDSGPNNSWLDLQLSDDVGHIIGGVMLENNCNSYINISLDSDNHASHGSGWMADLKAEYVDSFTLTPDLKNNAPSYQGIIPDEREEVSLQGNFEDYYSFLMRYECRFCHDKTAVNIWPRRTR